ncbi:DUF520 family protein [Trueperella pyogenes]|nr:DUF520 family protein [Trueperella pyogenes]
MLRRPRRLRPSPRLTSPSPLIPRNLRSLLTRQRPRRSSPRKCHAGKVFKLIGLLKEGISQENAKKITRLIRDEGPKSVKAQIQGDEVRVTSKSRDDLQVTIALLKGTKFDVALRFVNFR